MRKYYRHQIGIALMLMLGVTTGLGAVRRVLYILLLNQERSSIYWTVELGLAVIMIVTAVFSYAGYKLKGTEVVVSLLFVTYFTYFVIRAVMGVEKTVNIQNANVLCLIVGLAMFSAFVLFYTIEAEPILPKAENRMVTVSGFVLLLLGAGVGLVLAILRYQTYVGVEKWSGATFDTMVFYPAMIAIGEYLFVALGFIVLAVLLFVKWQRVFAYVGMGIALRELLFGWLQFNTGQPSGTGLTMEALLPLFIGIIGFVGFFLFIGGAKRGEQEETT
ncbi:hypothetical protein HCB69_00085 [Listeria booriae]|uniref:Uncharacterized protein n=1 Tax=Listeria booriae TaxID=1552123 RepID=A0A842G7T0_9LIST|nr:hypothetical protein [Listeria booriae]MBC2282769.1 hypothetical protein [Listeria booriae]MBC2292533.1 hypothetical protein [Listeria booriae]